MSLVTIQDTILDALDQPQAGVAVLIDLLVDVVPGSLAFDGTGQFSIDAQTYVLTDADGYWEAALRPNSELSPAGSVYRLTYKTSGSRRYVVTVPASGGPYWVGDILALTQPTGPLVDAAEIGYTPADATKWRAPVPAKVGEALDAVASPGVLAIDGGSP